MVKIEYMKSLPWVLAVGFAISSAWLGLRPAQTIIKEVPRDVIRVESKEVPVEVIKKVPVEVVKEIPVEVVREVERPRTQEETDALVILAAMKDAEWSQKPSDNLKGIRKVALYVQLSDGIEKHWSKTEIEAKLSLEIRRSGIEVITSAVAADATVSFVVSDLAVDDVTTIYSIQVSVDKLISARMSDGKYHIWEAAIWHSGQFGRFGSKAAKDSQRDAVEMASTKLCGALLEANPLVRK